MINNKLIYDIGLHLGYDTKLYLDKGYNVVAIEANPFLIENSKKKFKKELKTGNVQLLNIAISNNDNQKLPFYISKSRSIQSSLQKSMAERNSEIIQIEVETFKLSTIIEKYGIPYYCKIDIEGYDYIALESLINTEKMPKFISAEISNLSVEGKTGEEIADINELFSIWLSILNRLKALGYIKFKVVEQGTLNVLNTHNIEKSKFSNNIISRVFRKLKRVLICWNFCPSLNFGFVSDCSGPFGDELAGTWSTYEEAEEIIKKYGLFMYNNGINVIWCDIHATK
ncbi:MAG: FkbM family methyltransferase [Bacteroidetes bacterium]|nr:FkbM family methyltransferase [Bacteroidota bacterium]